MKTKLLSVFSILMLLATFAKSQNLSEDASPDLTSAMVATANEIPAGSVLFLAFDSEVSSANAAVNDTFTTTLVEPLYVKGILMLPAKTIIQGRIKKVEKAGRGGRAGKLELIFERIDLRDGSVRDMKGEPVSLNVLKGKSSTPINATLIGGGLGIGAAIGAGTGGGSKTLIGGLFGAGIGIGAAVFAKGNEAILRANSQIRIEIKEKIVLPTIDY